MTIEEVEQIFPLSTALFGAMRLSPHHQGFDESCCLGFVFRPDSLGVGNFIDPSYWQAPGGKVRKK